MVKIRVPATTANLGPGFDCLGLALNLYLYLEIEEIEKGLDIQCRGEGAEEFDEGENNLIWKAAKRALKKTGQEYFKGIRIKTLNQIPISRGLGSSAAAIIGGIVGVTELYKINISYKEVLKIAFSLEGHMDNIVPALIGGLTLAYSTEKEKVKWDKVKIPNNLCIVAGIPDFYLSTEEMRKVLPQKIPFSKAVFNLSRTALLINVLQNSDWRLLADAMEDKLHQPFRMPFIPGIDEIFSKIKETGIAGIALSGSGPTIISLAEEGSAETIMQIMKETFLKLHINCQIFILKPDLEGARCVSLIQ